MQDWTPVPARRAEHLAAQETKKRDTAFNYGWPVLVARNQKIHPVIAPMFLVSVQVEQRDGQWIGDAKTEPEFNLSIVAGELFDMSATEVVDGVVGDGLPFGERPARHLQTARRRPLPLPLLRTTRSASRSDAAAADAPSSPSLTYVRA